VTVLLKVVAFEDTSKGIKSHLSNIPNATAFHIACCPILALGTNAKENKKCFGS
jgi:hypothetical protein